MWRTASLRQYEDIPRRFIYTTSTTVNIRIIHIDQQDVSGGFLEFGFYKSRILRKDRIQALTCLHSNCDACHLSVYFAHSKIEI